VPVINGKQMFVQQIIVNCTVRVGSLMQCLLCNG
jgi:hypothetical protein